MGAGKTTLGARGGRAARPPVRRPRRRDRASARQSIPELFEPARRGAASASVEARQALAAARTAPPAVRRARRRRRRARRDDARRSRERALTVWSTSTPTTPGSGRGGSDRPLAQDEAQFRRALRASGSRSTRRSPTRVARDADDVVLAAGGVARRARRRSQRLGELVPGDGRSRSSPTHASRGIHGADAQLALGGARLDARAAAGRGGEDASARSSASGASSGSTAAARSSRSAAAARPTPRASPRPPTSAGIAWVAVPTTLVGQVDAAIGGKTGDRPPARARTSSARSTGPRGR